MTPCGAIDQAAVLGPSVVLVMRVALTLCGLAAAAVLVAAMGVADWGVLWER